MKCKNCSCCNKGFFEWNPDAYVCVGVPEHFVIRDIDVECTEYPEDNEDTVLAEKSVTSDPIKTYVMDDGIYIPDAYDYMGYRMFISKETFIEAYNKWIKNNNDLRS